MNVSWDIVLDYFELVAEFLSAISCIWYFFMYFRQKDKPIQLSLLFVLLISDSLISINFALRKLFENFFVEHWGLLIRASLFCMMFSIAWSATIAYLVYRSFLEYDFDVNQIFYKALIVTSVPIFLFLFL